MLLCCVFERAITYCVEFGGTVSVTECVKPWNGVNGANVAYDAADRIDSMKPCPLLPRFVGTELAFAFD